MENVDSEGRILLENYERFINRKGEGEREKQQDMYNAHLAKRGVGPPLYYELSGSIRDKVNSYLGQGLGEYKIQTLLLDDPEFGQFREEHRKKENAGYTSVPWDDVFGEAKASALGDAVSIVGALFDPRSWVGMVQGVGQAMDLATRLKMGQTGWGQGETGSFVPLMTKEQARDQTPTSLDEWPILSSMVGEWKDYTDEGGRKKIVAKTPVRGASDALMTASVLGKGFGATLQLANMPRAAIIASKVGTGLDILDPSGWAPRAIRGVGGWLMPKKGEKTSASTLRTEDRLMKRELLKEPLVTSAVTSDPKAIKHDNFLFEKKNKKLRNRVMATLDMPTILAEKLGNVTVATASAKVMAGFEQFEDNFYRVQEELWNNLRQAVEAGIKDFRKWKTAPELQEGGPEATSMGIGLKNAGVVKAPPGVIIEQGSEALAAIEGTFAHTQEAFHNLQKGESRLPASEWIKDVEKYLELRDGGSATYGPLATDLEQLQQMRTRIFHALKKRPPGEVGLHPTTRSYLKRMYLGLTDDMDQAAINFSENANHPLWGRIGQHFAVDFKKIRTSHAKGKAVADGKVGLAIKRAREEGHDLMDFVHQYAFRGDKGKNGGPLLTSEIAPFYQAMDEIDPSIASDLRSAIAIRMIEESRGKGGILNVNKLGGKIADLGHGRDRSQGEIRLAELLGDDIAEDLLGIEKVFNEMETSGVPMDVIRAKGGLPPDMGWMEDFKGLKLDNIARLIFGGAPGVTGSVIGMAASTAMRGGVSGGARAAMLGRGAVALIILGTDAYKGLVDTRKRYVTGGGFPPLAEVIAFIEKADLPTRVAIKGGQRSYISQQEAGEGAARLARKGSQAWQQQQEALDKIISGPLQQ